MRDIAFLPVIGLIGLMALAHPWIGIMGWTWVSMMNPHQYTWRAAEMPVAAVLAAATLIGMVLTRDRLQFYLTPATSVFLLFVLWMCITYPFSIYPEASLESLFKVLKIDFMVLIAIFVIVSKKHIIMLSWVLAGSLGFFGAKGGLFTIFTGGAGRVWGPPGSFIEGNNELGLALIMTIPLIRFLQMRVEPTWVRLSLGLVMILSAVAAIGTQSRGALLALTSMAAFMTLKSRHKLAVGFLVGMVGIGVLMFMPDSWYDRMSTIQSYEEDGSAMGRVNAWWFAYNVAGDRFFGSGYENVTDELFSQYAPYHGTIDPQGPHSIYFQVLGQHGWVGLSIFLLLWFLVWRTASRVVNLSRNSKELKWCADLCLMCQVSLVGYLVGGAFLGLAYFDLPYNFMILIVTTYRWIQVRGWELEEGRPAETSLNWFPWASKYLGLR